MDQYWLYIDWTHLQIYQDLATIFILVISDCHICRYLLPISWHEILMQHRSAYIFSNAHRRWEKIFLYFIFQNNSNNSKFLVSLQIFPMKRQYFFNIAHISRQHLTNIDFLFKGFEMNSNFHNIWNQYERYYILQSVKNNDTEF